MNNFINTHGDQIFNGVFLTLLLVTAFAAVYAWRTMERDRKAFLGYIKKECQTGYLAVSPDGRVIFIRTNPDGSPFIDHWVPAPDKDLDS